jgi:archaemetzincin
MAPQNSKAINFHRRFKVPTRDAILKILRPTESVHRNKSSSKRLSGVKHVRIFETVLTHFKQLPKPTDELDWLAQFNEQPQSCDQFLTNTPVSSKEIGHTRFIYYIQIGDFSNAGLEFNQLVDYSKCFFNNASVVLMPIKIEIKLEETGSGKLMAKYGDLAKPLKYRKDSKSGHLQILAQSVHSFLHRIKKADTFCLIGFTGYDLFADESDLFVAGLCDPYKRVGVFSCFRYTPRLKYSDEFWHGVKRPLSGLGRAEDRSLLLARSCKLLVHETCHLLGFEHCVYMDCCMNGSGHLAEDFRQSMFLCPVDLKKLAHVFEFDIKERYEAMRSFFERHALRNEVEWLAKVISEI